MSSVILQAEGLNLPEPFATKLKGKKIEFAENDGVITIKPIDSVDTVISELRGILKDSNFGVDKFLEQKNMDKELEY